MTINIVITVLSSLQLVLIIFQIFEKCIPKIVVVFILISCELFIKFVIDT